MPCNSATIFLHLIDFRNQIFSYTFLYIDLQSHSRDQKFGAQILCPNFLCVAAVLYGYQQLQWMLDVARNLNFLNLSLAE